MNKKLLTTVFVIVILLIISAVVVIYSLSVQNDKTQLTININYYTQSELSRPVDVIAELDPNSRVISSEGLEQLKSQINGILGSSASNYSYIVRDYSTGLTITHLADEIRPPASIYKVPLAMMVLRDIDDGNTDFSDEFLLEPKHKPYSFDYLAQRSGSYYISLDDLLYYLVSHSDNAAMTGIEDFFRSVEVLQQRMKDELGVDVFTRNPHEVTAKDVEIVFDHIYHQTYLTEDTNNYLIQLMINVLDSHQDLLAAGLPEGITIAHKIGTLESVYADAGIIYAKHGDYFVVILNEDIVPFVARNKISAISEKIYNYFETGNVD